ncbi:sugar ABC transporter substrate-binding protein [Anaerococcus sp. NML200537]|uniref:sugar ABC transporter substrate-binding protein n=1 Tax=Anaerococcus sp. NML200537 TaxID=2954485 RepID=UPI002238CFBC|nr:sugar ABC transporter substrate-binding protein [Anaerococcus sp. NML200537]MCW6702562.1 sugar ABC transporter substrate-binding protein [Anaerococcus sp. NML200537]
MKNKFKSLMALSLAVVLTACGGAKDADKGADTKEAANTDAATKLTVQAEEGWVDYYKAAAERVKKQFPNADIEIKTVGSFDNLDIIDSTDATNEDVADLFAIPADRLYGLHGNDVLGAIDSKKLAEEIGGWDDFDKGLGGNFNIDGEYFAFPFNIETLITYVNSANAKEKNVDLSKPIEIEDVADESTVLFPLFDAWYGVAATNSSNIELLGKKEDGTLYSDFTKEWDELEPEKQATVKALFDYWKKHNEAGTQLFDADAGWGYIDDTFKPGNGGVARLGGPWDAAAIGEQAGEGNLEIHPIGQLTLAGKPLTHWQGGWGLAMNARIEEDADKVALAEAMIKEIVNPEFAADLYKASGKILENVPVEKYKEMDLSDTDKNIIEATIASYKEAPARPLFKEWGDVWDTYKNAILSWNSVKPADEKAAYAEIKASFDSMMANFNK